VADPLKTATITPYPLNAIKRGKCMSTPGWRIMMKNGYQPGKGLGTQLQGRTTPVKDHRGTPGNGLGYGPRKLKQDIVQQAENEGSQKVWETKSTPHKEGRDPLTWTLYTHFVKGPVISHDNTVVITSCFDLHDIYMGET